MQHLSLIHIFYAQSCVLAVEIQRPRRYHAVFAFPEEYFVRREQDVYKRQIKHRMATIILSNADTPLAKRMTEKLTEFVEVIIANCEGVIEDDQNAAITILNSTEVRIALRREYINYLTKKISDLRLIRDAYIFNSLLLSLIHI